MILILNTQITLFSGTQKVRMPDISLIITTLSIIGLRFNKQLSNNIDNEHNSIAFQKNCWYRYCSRF